MLFVISATFALSSAMAANKAIDIAQKKLKDGKYDDAIAGLEAELKRAPKNAEVKTALAQAHFVFGEFHMYSKGVPPVKKYPPALRQFRKTVELDPGNRKAKDHIGMIEGIYRGMKKPIPE